MPQNTQKHTLIQPYFEAYLRDIPAACGALRWVHAALILSFHSYFITFHELKLRVPTYIWHVGAFYL